MANNITLPGGPTVRTIDLGGGVHLLLTGLTKADGTDAVEPILTALGLNASADQVFAITKHDTNPLATVPKALLCTVSGNLVLKGTGSEAVTIPVTAGQIIPIRARYVLATGNTATVVGLA